MASPSFGGRALVVVLVSVPLVSLVGCGASSKGAASPYTAPEPKTMDEAESQLAAAERDLGGGAPSSATPAEAAPAGGATQSDQPKMATPPEPRESVHAEASGSSSGSEEAPSPCETPCRAIASMRNAVRAICRIAGDADPKCTDAKGRLSASEARISSCGC